MSKHDGNFDCLNCLISIGKKHWNCIKMYVKKKDIWGVIIAF